MRFKTLLAVLLIFSSPAAMAVPVEWGHNGNLYQVVTTDRTLTWEQARDFADLLGGHLVTITSEGENNFVANLLWDYGEGNRERYWLGGYQTDPGNESCEPSGCWAWVTGEDWTYENWEVGEPNNGVGGTQHYLHYWRTPGLFDDMENRDIMIGFIVEYEVPAPGTLALLGLGLIGIAARRRKRQHA